MWDPGRNPVHTISREGAELFCGSEDSSKERDRARFDWAQRLQRQVLKPGTCIVASSPATRHSEPFYQYATQFLNDLIKLHQLPVHGPDPQGKMQTGDAQDAQTRPERTTC